MSKLKQPIELEKDGGFLTVKGTNRCVGNLVHFEGRGVYDAELGKLPVSPEEAVVHNKLFNQALLKGLDETCEIGQHGTFYFNGDKVITFMGDVVSDSVVIKGRSLIFTRKGRTFRGRTSQEHTLFNFKRIA